MWDVVAGTAVGHVASRSALPFVLPAAAFWAVGTAALVGQADAIWWRRGLTTILPGGLQSPSTERPTIQQISDLSTTEQFYLASGVLILIGLSALFLRWAALRVLRLSEGYWPRGFGHLAQWSARRKESDRAKKLKRLQTLADGLERNMLSLHEEREYVRLDEQLELMIPQQNLLPTHFGNLLRAAEQAPGRKYGLNTFVCWPRLWLVMPDSTKETIVQARANLNSAAACVLASVLLIVWSLAIWWMPAVALLLALLSYRSMFGLGFTYGELVVAAFDVHRWDLYEKLRWPNPYDAEEELTSGLHLTQFLLRGWEVDDAFLPIFTAATENTKPPPQSPPPAPESVRREPLTMIRHVVRRLL